MPIVYLFELSAGIRIYPYMVENYLSSSDLFEYYVHELGRLTKIQLCITVILNVQSFGTLKVATITDKYHFY